MTQPAQFNKRIFLGLAIPLILIIVTVTAFLWPKWHQNFSADFIIAVGDKFCDTPFYIIGQNHLLENPAFSEKPAYCLNNKKVRLYRYKSNENSLREISFNAAAKLRLDPQNPKSGFNVRLNTEDYALASVISMMGHRNYDCIYVIGHGAGAAIALPKNVYSAQVRFIGWVE